MFYAVVVCQGAVLLKIEKTKHSENESVFCAWQVVCRCHRSCVTLIPYLADIAKNVSYVGGIYLSHTFLRYWRITCYYKAWKNEAFSND